MRKQGLGAFLKRKQYVIAGAVVAVAVVGTTMIYSNNQEKEREQLEAQLAQEMQASEQQVAVAEESEAAEQVSTVIPPKTVVDGTAAGGVELEDEFLTEAEASSVDEEAQVVAENNDEASEDEAKEVAAVKETLHFVPENGILWPMEGNVILNYSMDSTVYFATLEQYKYNPAVIIEGEVNDKIISVAKGKVTDISTNEVTGCTMTVDLGDGYTAIYGQIKEPKFAVGDYVESGHVLGFVAEPTKYFSVEGSNLYFALEKDGEPISPIEFFE